ncbi:MAG: HAD-IA family hydrolase [Ahrensia sp.]
MSADAKPDQWLIVFDCDGVLVDTEALANKRLAELVTQAGLPMTYEQSRARFVGMSLKSIRTLLLDEDGVDLGSDFAEHWQQSLPEIFAQPVPAIDGIHEALDAIERAGHTVCVASSGTVNKMRLTLGSAGLWDRLSGVLFSADMVARGKPAPDLFWHAAATMGHAPQHCIVIEDSPFGAQAAHAAGMACFGYAADPLTNVTQLAEQGAMLFDDMAKLPGLIEAHIKQSH